MQRVRALGLWVLGGLAPAVAMPPYELSKWDANPEAELVSAVEKKRGVKIAAVRWDEGWFGVVGSPRITKAVMGCLVRTAPLATAPRLSRGIMFSVYRESSEGKAWEPGLPHRWAVQRESSPYAMVAAPGDLPPESTTPALASLVYGQPMTVSPNVTDAEILALTDFFWRLASEERSFLKRARPFGGSEEYPVGPLFLENGQPFFQNLAAVERIFEMTAVWRRAVDQSVRPEDFALTLSQGGDGCEILIVRKMAAGYRVISQVSVDF